MSIKSDKWIQKMSEKHDMISPFTPKQVKSDKISYGVSSYGYDIRVSDEYKIFRYYGSARKEEFHSQQEEKDRNPPQQ